MRFANVKFLSLLTMIIGSLSWSLTMVKSGLVYPFGMGFWGPNGHDGVWHVSLINHIARGSLNMPVFAGEPIRNYHWFYDGFLALIHKVTQIPAHTLYFQIFPPLIAFLVGWLTYKFVLEWRKSEWQALFAVFFVYFGASFGWLVSFLRSGSFGGESMFWANQAISTLINAPYAASLVLLLTGMLLFLRKNLVLAALVFGILLQVKVYAGIIALVGLALTRNVKLFFGSLIVALLVFLPTNRNAGGLAVFAPLWFPETMVAFADRFYWPRLASAIASYKSGGNFVKLIPAEALALAIFWFGNLGTRVVKEPVVFKWLKNWRKLEPVQALILGMVGAGVVLPLLFIQKGNPWNTIQFLYYALFLSAILAGVYLGEWLEKRKSFLFILLAIGLTLPTTIDTLTQSYLPGRPPASIPHEELAALEFLKEQPDGVVLTYPFNPEMRKNWEPPQPLWVYETTSYVSAFSEKLVFLEEEMNLEITGYNWRPRRKAAEEFFAGYSGQEFLENNNIAYIYLAGGQKLPDRQLPLEEIFSEGNVRIYKVL